MQTTINRQGQITQLTFKEKMQSAVVSFRGGYAKFFFSDEDAPNGFMLKDKVEVSLIINTEE